MSQPSSDTRLHQFSAEILSGMHEWRQQHPRATLRAIEEELDARWARVRAHLLEDLALQSAATAWAASPAGEQPHCPSCAAPLQERGTQSRTLHTHGGHTLTLEREYGTCSVCVTGLFPPR